MIFVVIEINLVNVNCSNHSLFFNSINKYLKFITSLIYNKGRSNGGVVEHAEISRRAKMGDSWHRNLRAGEFKILRNQRG